MKLGSVLRHSKRFASILSLSLVTSAQAASLRESIGSHKVLVLGRGYSCRCSRGRVARFA